MTVQRFDPLNDRLSRDIRNDLSEAFAHGLAQGKLAPVEAVASRYRATGLAPIYEAYIVERLNRYRAVLRTIIADGVEGPFLRALVLWDSELFFEVHEVLEHVWLKARGAEKAVLQAMIRAAGMYIKFGMGQKKAACAMAAKAAAALLHHRQSVPPEVPLEVLLAKLRACDPVPPKLYQTASRG